MRHQATTIYIDRELAKKRLTARQQKAVFSEGRKSVLVVLFVPSVERDGRTAVNQNHGDEYFAIRNVEEEET